MSSAIPSMSSRSRRPTAQAAIVSSLLSLAFLVCSSVALAGLRQTGQWSSLYPFGSEAVHSILVRVGADSSRVVFWGFVEDSMRAWNPGTALSGTDPPPSIPRSSYNLFCSGHVLLPNGHLLVTGGDYGAATGLEKTFDYDPVPFPGTWTNGPSMGKGRWYPTSTLLYDGSVLSTSGNQFSHLYVYGGNDGSATLSDTRALALSVPPRWKSAASPGLPQRENHSLVLSQDGFVTRLWIFGGRNGSSLNSDLMQINYTSNNDNQEDVWDTTHVSTTGAGAQNNDYPRARERHTAILSPGDHPYMIICGGLDANGNPLSDVWKLPLETLHWERLSPADTTAGPGPRYGHVAFLDSSVTTEVTGPRMLVFGGRTTSGTLADNDVYVLTLSATPTWSKLTLRSGSAKPRPREGHAGIADAARQRIDPDPWHWERRVVVYGGRDGSGNIINSDSLWYLWMPDEATPAPEWKSFVPQPDPTLNRRPAPRANFSGVLGGMDEFIFFGGDTLGTGLSNETWKFYAGGFDAGANQPWVRVPNSANLPIARKGHVAAYSPEGINARVPEKLTDGSWSPTSASKVFPNYPFIFQLPDSLGQHRVFFAGENAYSYIMPLNGNWGGGIFAGNFYGGSAALYVRGDSATILRCGGPYGPDSTTYIAFRANGTRSSWLRPDEGSASFSPRIDHNLTVLPTGEVLATGGHTINDNEETTSTRAGQIWNPATWKWSIELASDPARRNYHSSAILLPDGRVLSAGGYKNPDSKKASIYSPWYLFNSNDSLATRPPIGGAPDTLGYGTYKTICTSDAANIGSACLIAPGAATHAFNQHQRFVALPIANTCGQQVIIRSPLDPSFAPPGDYMLFLVRTDSVPSVAKWIRLNSAGGQDDCDTVRPAATTDLTLMDRGKTFVDLSWTAPGDDSLCGTAQRFDVRYSRQPITLSTWSTDSIATGIPTPGPSGTIHSCITVSGLTPCTNYYFGIRTMDDRPQLSALSNVVSGTTLCSGSNPVCDGGGSFVQGGGDGGWATENTILSASRGTLTTDLCALHKIEADGPYDVRLVQMGSGSMEVDQVSVGVADHAPGLSAFASSRGVLLGNISPVRSVMSGSADISGRVTGEGGEPYAASPGQTLVVTLQGRFPRTALVLESCGYLANADPDSTGILVQSPQENGTLRTLARIEPRRTPDCYAIETEGAEQLRVTTLGECSIQSLRQLRVVDRLEPKALDLTRATHSRLGDVSNTVGSAGGNATSLVGGETLELEFEPTAAPRGKTRDLFLTVRGACYGHSSAGETHVTSAGSSATFEYTLGSARPNPTSRAVSFSFTMAKAGPTLIRVYDVAGRLVKTLMNGSTTAGPHEVVWDGLDDRGRLVGSGVYFYRMDVGAWRSQRKVVFLER